MRRPFTPRILSIAACLLASCGSGDFGSPFGAFRITSAGHGVLISNTAWDYFVFARPEVALTETVETDEGLTAERIVGNLPSLKRKFMLDRGTPGWTPFVSPSTRFTAWVSPHSSTVFVYDAETTFLAAHPSKPLQTSVIFSSADRWALTYVDPLLLPANVEVKGAIGFSDVTQIDLSNGTSEVFGIGEPPDLITFTRDEQFLVFVTSSRLSRWRTEGRSPDYEPLDLPIRINQSTVVLPAAMAVTPDNRYALLGLKGGPDLFILDLENPSVRIEPLGAVPSSILVTVFEEASSDGTDREIAYAVIQDQPGSSRWFRMNLDNFELTSFKSEVAIQRTRFSADGRRMLLIPPGSASVIAQVEIETGIETVATLVKRVSDAILSADGRYGFVIHNDPGSGVGDPQRIWEKRMAVSLIDFGSRSKVATPLVIEQPASRAFLNPAGSAASFFLDGVPRAVHLEFNPGSPVTLDLPFVPEATIGLRDGTLAFLTSTPLGAVGFLQPASGAVQMMEGIEIVGVLDQ